MGLASSKRCCISSRKHGTIRDDDFTGAGRNRPKEPAKRSELAWVKTAARRAERLRGKKANGTVQGSGQPGDEESGDPAGLRRQDTAQQLSWVEQVFDGEPAVIVSDLSGFTKMTRKYGIQHFASIIVRKRQLCLPILKHYGALHIGTEADNLIVVFPDACSAAKAAVEMQRVITDYKQTLPEGREHFQIPLNGIGVHCAEDLLLDREDGLHGEAFRFGYHIGEDLAEDGKVLVSDAVKGRIEKDAFFGSATFEPIDAEDCEIKVFSVEGETIPAVGEQVPTSDARFLHEGLLLLAKRHDPEVDVQQLDAEIKEKCMGAHSVLMFNFDTLNAGGMVEQVALKFLGIDIMKPAAERHNGDRVEEALWVFKTPLDAALAALDLRKTIKDYNAEQSDDAHKLVVKGYGIHTGQLLFISGTDIHWGDPVNTSSKLGQDLATNGDILMTPDAIAAAKEDPRWTSMQVHLLPRKLYRSGVELPCSSVFDGSESETANEACSCLLDSQVGEGALESVRHAAFLAQAVDATQLPMQLHRARKLPDVLHLGVEAKKAKEAGTLSELPLSGASFQDEEVLARAARYARLASAAVLGGSQADLAGRAGLAAEAIVHLQAASDGCPLFFVADDPESRSLVLCVQGAGSAPEDVAWLSRGQATPFAVAAFGAGRAPAALVAAAKQVEAAAWPVLQRLLGAAPAPRRVALVGHGVGAGVASLLALRALGAEGSGPPAWAAGLLPAPGAQAEAAEAQERLLECFAFGPPPCFSGPAALPAAVHERVFSFVRGFDCLPRTSAWTAARLLQRVAQADAAAASLDELLAGLAGAGPDAAAEAPPASTGQAAEGNAALEEHRGALSLNVVGQIVLIYEEQGMMASVMSLIQDHCKEALETLQPEQLQEVLVHPAMLKDHAPDGYAAALAKFTKA